MGAFIELECKCGYVTGGGVGPMMDETETAVFHCQNCKELFFADVDDGKCNNCGNTGKKTELNRASWFDRFFLGIKKSKKLPRFIGFTKCPKCNRRVQVYNTGYAD